jgi:uncharacterized protein (DUF1810 family)
MSRFDLERFIDAQDRVYSRVIAELEAGEKRSHWMWFVFPQLAGLGHSAMAQHYGIEGIEEARAYLAHPVLGARLGECVELVMRHGDRTAHAIFGSPDDLKFRSSLTLFDRAADDGPFSSALEMFFDGSGDPRTGAMLQSECNASRRPSIGLTQ